MGQERKNVFNQLKRRMMEPIVMSELMNAVVLEITAKQIFFVVGGAFIGAGITFLVRNFFKGKQ